MGHASPLAGTLWAGGSAALGRAGNIRGGSASRLGRDGRPSLRILSRNRARSIARTSVRVPWGEILISPSFTSRKRGARDPHKLHDLGQRIGQFAQPQDEGVNGGKGLRAGHYGRLPAVKRGGLTGFIG